MIGFNTYIDHPDYLSGKTSEVAIVVGTSCKVYQLSGQT